MRRDDLFSGFLRYASLNVLGMLGLSCYILADTYFIAKGMGADGLAALNLAIPVYSFMNGAALMLGMGGATRYSILRGAGDREGADPIFTKTLAYAAALAALFVLIGLFGAERLASLLGAKGAVYDMTRTYLRVILLFSPAFLLNQTLLCFVRNDGGPHLAMAAMVSGSLANIVLDYVFIFPCGMGIFGAVLATGCAPLISIAILSFWFFQKNNSLRLTRMRLDLRTAGDLAALGGTSLVVEVSSGVVILVFNLLILSLEGSVGVAAYGVIANLSLVALSIFTGLGQGVQPLVSRCWGRGEREQTGRVYRYALVSALLFAVAVYGLIWAFPAQIAAAFNGEGDLGLQRMAERGLRLYFLGLPFAGFNMVSAACLSAMERARPAFLISVLRGFALILPLTGVLAGLLGMTGVWLSFPAAELGTAVVTACLLGKNGIFRKRKKIF